MTALLCVSLALCAVLGYFVVVCQREITTLRGKSSSGAARPLRGPDCRGAAIAGSPDSAGGIQAAAWAASVQLAEENEKLREELRALRFVCGESDQERLHDELSRRLAELRRLGTPFSLVRLDVKQATNPIGHQGHADGDSLRRDVLQLLRKICRGMDVILRCGARGFAVVLPGITLVNAELATKRIVESAANATLTAEGTPGKLAFVAGVVEAVRGESPEDLLRRANAALDVAQHDAQNSVFLHDGQSCMPSAVVRRRQRRYSIETLQRIAPCPDGQLPNAADFRDVICKDISTGGFAFLTSQRPTFDRLVVELGTQDEPKYMTAVVKNCVAIASESGTQFRVGCMFTGRLGE